MHHLRLIAMGAVCAMMVGCAKPDYAMVSQMHGQTMAGNVEIAKALAGMNNAQAEFIFPEAVTLPAGTIIRTYYDFSHAFKFNDAAHNPAVEIFKAEAARDASVASTVVGGAVTLGGIGIAADFGKTAIKRAGGFTLQNSGDGTQTMQGGIGDRFSGTGGVTEPSTIDMSDNVADPVVVTPPTSTGTISQDGSAGWQVQ